MQINNVSFGTKLLVDKNNYSKKGLADCTADTLMGIRTAREMLAKNGNSDTLTLYCSDNMIGNQNKERTYMALELDNGFPEVFNVDILKKKGRNEVTKLIVDAYYKLLDWS